LSLKVGSETEIAWGTLGTGVPKGACWGRTPGAGVMWLVVMNGERRGMYYFSGRGNGMRGKCDGECKEKERRKKMKKR
jgi:hypothetical protein